jgi:hypothetical protein
MTRSDTGGILAGIAAIGYLGTALLHSTGYSSVAKLATEVPSDLGPLIPALWLVFSLDLAVLGVIVGVVAWRRPQAGWLILVIASLQPLGAASLQLRWIGFVPPTAILLAVAAVTLAASALLRRDPAPAV